VPNCPPGLASLGGLGGARRLAQDPLGDAMGVDGPHAGPVWISGGLFLAHGAAGLFGMFATGGGHGMYAPLVFFFPYGMLAAIAGGEIARAALVLAFLQPVAYAILLSIAEVRDSLRRVTIRTFGVHLAVALIAAAAAVWSDTFPLLYP
jgi:hypothetical protein